MVAIMINNNDNAYGKDNDDNNGSTKYVDNDVTISVASLFKA